LLYYLKFPESGNNYILPAEGVARYSILLKIYNGKIEKIPMKAFQLPGKRVKFQKNFMWMN